MPTLRSTCARWRGRAVSGSPQRRGRLAFDIVVALEMYTRDRDRERRVPLLFEASANALARLLVALDRQPGGYEWLVGVAPEAERARHELGARMFAVRQREQARLDARRQRLLACAAVLFARPDAAKGGVPSGTDPLDSRTASAAPESAGGAGTRR